MSKLNKTAARLLIEQRAPLAEAVTARQYEAQPELLAKYGAAGRAKCLQDAGYHLSYLADSVAAESPSLFYDYVGWAKVMLGARGIPAGDLSRNLSIMREVIRQRCPPDLWGVVDEFFEAGLKDCPHCRQTSRPCSPTRRRTQALRASTSIYSWAGSGTPPAA